jgi:hypothetical protein
MSARLRPGRYWWRGRISCFHRCLRPGRGHPLAVSGTEHPKNGVISAAIRVTAGSQPGLRSGWTHGQLSARPGALTFRPGGRLGLRFPKGKVFDIPAAAVPSGGRGQVGLANAWSVNPMLATRRIVTPDATIVVAAPRAGLDELARELAPHG